MLGGLTRKISRVERKAGRAFGDFAEALPGHVRSVFREHCFLAGGAVWSICKGRKPRNCDFFCDDRAQLGKIVNWTSVEADVGFVPAFVSNDSEWLTLRIRGKTMRLSKTRYGNPEDVLSQFDFVHNMFAVRNGKLIPGADLAFLGTDSLIPNAKSLGSAALVAARVPAMVAKGLRFGERDMAWLLMTMCNEGNDRIFAELSLIAFPLPGSVELTGELPPKPGRADL